MKRGPAAVRLDDEDGLKRILVAAVFGLWAIVNNLTRLRPPHRERYGRWLAARSQVPTS